MNFLKRLLFAALIAIVFLAATERQASFTDPGTRSLIIRRCSLWPEVLFQFRRIRIWFKSRNGPKG